MANEGFPPLILSSVDGLPQLAELPTDDYLYANVAGDISGALFDDLDMAGYNIINVSTVDGVDVSARNVDLSTFENIMEGAIIESISISAVEESGDVKLKAEANGGGNLTCRIKVNGDQNLILSCTPTPAEIVLTAGTDTNPQENWIYVSSDGVSSVFLDSNTTGFPTSGHCPIATVVTQSASSVSANGPYKVHAWTDHYGTEGGTGHLSHVNAKLRTLGADWTAGVAPADMVISSPDAYISTTSGSVFQLHPHNMPAINMQSGDTVYVLNDPTTPYKPITTFDDITQDSAGGSINNKYMTLVVWGVVSEREEDCKLFINLPDGTYNNEADAIADNSQYNVYSFPGAYTGTAFLIAAYTVQAKDSGAWSQSQKVDLRGLKPATAAGGGGLTDHGNLAGLTDDDHTQYFRADGTRNMAGSIEMANNDIDNVADFNGRSVALSIFPDIDGAIQGPGSSTSGALVRYGGTTGKTALDSPNTSLDGAGNLTVAGIVNNGTTSLVGQVETSSTLSLSGATHDERGALNIQTQDTIASAYGGGSGIVSATMETQKNPHVHGAFHWCRFEQNGSAAATSYIGAGIDDRNVIDITQSRSDVSGDNTYYELTHDSGDTGECYWQVKENGVYKINANNLLAISDTNPAVSAVLEIDGADEHFVAIIMYVLLSPAPLPLEWVGYIEADAQIKIRLIAASGTVRGTNGSSVCITRVA